MRSIPPERWRRIEPILERALELEGEARRKYLETACDGDEELRGEVQALLDSDSEAHHFLSGGVGELAPTLLRSDRSSPEEAGSDSELRPDGSRRYLPGTLIAGRYRIFGLIGEGGMGEVYRADDTKLGQDVALKFLPGAVEREGGLDRFLSEVRLARQIAHPNVCRVYDVGEADGRHFLSMEFVDGEDLASLLRRIGRLPKEKAIEIGRQLASGLAAAHAQGILHRDLKPANVMIDGRGRVRITDFGLAMLAGDVDGREVLSGTPAYMAPEQLAGREVTERSDLYALGLVLYELVTGRHPHADAAEAETIEELRERRDSSVAVRPSSHVEGLDASVERVILRCLEPRPADRPAAASVVAAALPGGDPLAAARAAGETPSPEMVAEAAGTEGLSPPAALLCFGGVLACLAWIAFSAPGVLYNSRVPWELSPAELERAAREVVESSGWDPPVVDSGTGFEDDIRFLQRAWTPAERGEAWADPSTARPAPMMFWYRQGAVELVPFSVMTRLTLADPPNAPGGIDVALDPRGELIRFRAAPRRSRDVEAGTDLAATWTAFLELAGIDSESIVPVEPRLELTVRADSEAAWEGRFADAPGTPARIEAAAFRGRPVHFEVVPTWAEGVPLRRLGVGRTPPLAGAIMMAALLGSIPLARRNLRLGRADRRGAFRLAVFGVTLRALSWALTTHHVASGLEVQQIFKGLMQATFLGGLMPWILYLALEPFVRRLWPESLTSWSRLLDGRVRDPVVGRHVLVGAVVGLLVASTVPAIAALTGSLGGPDWAIPSPRIAVGPGEVLAAWAGGLQSGVRLVLTGTVLFLLAKLLLRRKILALIGFAAAASLILAAAPGRGLLDPTSIAGLLQLIAVAGLLLRLGLLAAIAGFFFPQIVTFPLTADPSSWLFPQTALTLALFAAPAAFALHTSLAGRPLLSWQSLESGR